MQNRKDLRSRDKRNIYLLKEGIIAPGSAAADGLSQAELDKRQVSFAERKATLEKNPNLYVSKTRLSLRNLWAEVGEKELGALCRGAVLAFDREVAEGKRQGIEAELLEDEEEEKPRGRKWTMLKQAKLLVESERLDDKGKPRSKGIGFVEFRTHEDAIKCLRWLNNNPACYGLLLKRTEEGGIVAEKKGVLTEDKKGIPESARKRPIVEFAVENRLVVKKREESIAKSLARNSGVAPAVNKVEPRKTGTPGFGAERDRKRKRDDAGGDEGQGKGKGKPVRHERWNQSSKKRKVEGAEAEAGGRGKKDAAKDRPAAKPRPAAAPRAPKRAAKPAAPSKPRDKNAPKVFERVGAAPPKKVSKEQREEADFDSMVSKYKKNLFG